MITGTNRSKTKHTTWEERRSRLRVQQPLRNSLHLLQKNESDSGKCLRCSRCWKRFSMTSCFDFMPKCKHQHSTRFNTMQLWFKTYNTFSHRNIEDSPIWVCVKISGWGNPSILGPHLETDFIRSRATTRRLQVWVHHPPWWKEAGLLDLQARISSIILYIKYIYTVYIRIYTYYISPFP